jgi:hypothetical protein
VVGKLFNYHCFEGTRGAGRITENGGVAGTIQFRGNGATRYAVLPANTLHVIGDRVCASVKGVPFQPCFNVIKTSANSFRGSVSGLGFAYCDFVRRDRPMIASVERPRGRSVVSGEPMELHANTGAAAAAFPKPIQSSELPPVEDAPAEAKAADPKPSEASASAAATDSGKPELRSTKD